MQTMVQRNNGLDASVLQKDKNFKCTTKENNGLSDSHATERDQIFERTDYNSPSNHETSSEDRNPSSGTEGSGSPRKEV